MNTRDPSTWAPTGGRWHPDFDESVDYRMLQAVGLAVLRDNPLYEVELQLDEPPYLTVQVRFEGRELAEIHTVQKPGAPGDFWYGVFDLREGGHTEIYVATPNEVTKALSSMR